MMYRNYVSCFEVQCSLPYFVRQEMNRLPRLVILSVVHDSPSTWMNTDEWPNQTARLLSAGSFDKSFLTEGRESIGECLGRPSKKRALTARSQICVDTVNSVQ